MRPTVFISFSTADRKAALSLYKDLSAAGAKVFQFEESAVPGMPAWTQVLENIELSDIFLLLVSRDAIKSKPVRNEIEFAYYQYTNEGRPNILVPLLLERGLKLPRELRAATSIDFTSYDAGFRQLRKLLKIEEESPAEGHQRTPSILIGKGTEPRSPSGLPGARLASVQEVASPDPKPPAGLKILPSPELPGNLGRGSFANILIYSSVILSIACVAIVVGVKLNSWLLSFDSPRFLTSSRHFVHSLQHAGATFGVVCLIVIFWESFKIVDDEVPVDGYEYAGVSVKSFSVALAIGLAWSLLFAYEPSDRSILPIIFAVSTSAAVILFAVVMDEL